MLYIKSTSEEGGVMGVLMPVGEGGTYIWVSCSHIKFSLNDVQTLNETKFDLCKCMMRCHV